MVTMINIPLDKIGSVSEFNHVIRLRKEVYSQQYPAVDLSGYDIFDFHASIWLGRNNKEEVVSTSRLVKDSDSGLPSESHIKPYIHSMRLSGYKLAEFGRLINIERSNSHHIKAHFKAAYLAAISQSIDTVLLVTSAKKKKFYVRYFGAKVLCSNIGEDFGSGNVFSLYSWSIQSTAHAFFSWVNLPQDASNFDASSMEVIS